MERKIEVTADGSHTLFIPEMDEHYHSVNGAVQESRHVFLEAGFSLMEKNEINVLEFGFGTGLNAILTLMVAEESGKKVRYNTIEKYPLTVEEASLLNYSAILPYKDPSLFMSLHEASWGQPCVIAPWFELMKIKGDYNTCQWPSGIDLVYFDAFAPDKQPEVWNLPLFEKIYASMNDGGILTTYCAKGVVRRMLVSAGFSVERIPGPPGKREMLRARK